MHKLNRVVFMGLLTATAFASLSYGLTQVAIAQTNSSQRQYSWWQIFQNDPPVDEKAGGPRPDTPFCGIAPRSIWTNTEVWSDRPLFVWQGNWKKIGVRHSDSQEVFWSQTVTSTDNKVTYTGETLQPGQTYDWVILDPQNSPLFFIPFKIMEAQERDRIQVDLMSLEQDLKAKRAKPEQIANARANYFAQKQLWSDVLKEVYSVENPSAQLKEIIQKIPTELCASPSTPSAPSAPQRLGYVL